MAKAGRRSTPGSPPGTPEFVNALAIDPETPQTLYAATQDGIFKTTDSAASWTAANEGITAALKRWRGAKGKAKRRLVTLE